MKNSLKEKPDEEMESDTEFARRNKLRWEKMLQMLRSHIGGKKVWLGRTEQKDKC